MFKRKPRSYSQLASDIVYPRGGWSRAVRYIVHRVRRLPDEPSRIGRGVAAGVFISFTPLFGAHLLGGLALAWLMRGNLIAAVLGTLVGNPVTIPIIAVTSVGLGRWMLGVPGSMSPGVIMAAFTAASGQLWHNFMSIFDGRVAEWDRLLAFFNGIFLPYLVGGLIPGLIAATVFHYLTVPLVRTYHRRKLQRIARRHGAAHPGAGDEDSGEGR